jgi:hypothetical protein
MAEVVRMTLAEALNLKKTLNDEIGTLCNKRSTASRTISYDAEDTQEYIDGLQPERTVEDLTIEIDEKRTQLINLQVAINAANSDTLTEWGDGTISIDHLYLLRENKMTELKVAQSLGEYQQKSICKGRRQLGSNASGVMEFIKEPDTIRLMPYDVAGQRERAKQLEETYKLMNNELQKVNWATEIDVSL